MKEYKGIMTVGIEIVTFLFAAFGGFLTNIAPPSQMGVPYSVGFVSILVLIILLATSAIAKEVSPETHRRLWIRIGLASLFTVLPAAFFYYDALEQTTYWYPPEHATSRHIRASDNDLTETAKQYIANNPTDTCPACLELNLPSDHIWNAGALRTSRNRLLLLYTWLVLSVATAIFSLIEANLSVTRIEGGNPNGASVGPSAS